MAVVECTIELDFALDETSYAIDARKAKDGIHRNWYLEVSVSSPPNGHKYLMLVKAGTFADVLKQAIEHKDSPEVLVQHLRRILEEYEYFRNSVPRWALY